MARNPERHYEHPDPQPVSMPAGFKRPETLEERIRRLVRSERFAQAMAEQGVESFDEANDFDIDDDPVDPATPYEPFFDPALGTEVTPHQVLAEQAQIREETHRRHKQAKKPATEAPAPPATPVAAPPAEAS